MIKYPQPQEKYKHYKGGSYEIITLAKHTDTDDILVIYKSISFGTIHARPFKEFFDVIEDLSTNTFTVYRFEKIEDLNLNTAYLMELIDEFLDDSHLIKHNSVYRKIKKLISGKII